MLMQRRLGKSKVSIDKSRDDQHLYWWLWVGVNCVNGDWIETGATSELACTGKVAHISGH